MASNDFNLAEWKKEINNELAKIAAADTQDLVLKSLESISEKLGSFLNNLKDYIGQMKQLGNFQTKNKDIRKDSFNNFKNRALSQKKENLLEYQLYQNILHSLKEGYFILMKIREILIGPITYHIGFIYNGKTYHINIAHLDQLIKNTELSLSSRVSLTNNNLARLEVNIKDRIDELIKDNIAIKLEDSLYDEIQGYVNATDIKGQKNRHRYYISNNGQRIYVNPGHNGYNFTQANLWEVYNYMYKVKAVFSAIFFHQQYEAARAGNLAYFKGGDVFNEQDKFSTAFALTSMHSVYDTFEKLKEFLKNSSKKDIQEIKQELQKLFIQEVPTDKELAAYVNKEIDNLNKILKIS